MDLFNLRKKDNIDEYFVRENPDDLKDSKKIEEHDDIEESDYIEHDDLFFDNYDDIVETIEDNGWKRISSVASAITTLDKQIVFQKPIRASDYDTILEIICPTERIISICGIDECGIDSDDFSNSPNFFQIPHFFTLRCMDNNNVDLSPTTIISILKVIRGEEPEKYYEEFYGDLSPIVNGNGRLKRKEERYYFAETIVLQSGEKLIFRANNPNIDISKIDLLMMSDCFEKSEEQEE